ncbi:hypothetical protein C4N9_20490 [Pararhodobacter marinus]|uniref:DUF3168 domain-containing protein n=1 Tax=Pararhodobacter marinus TaxID=2184063 RepID=A0A2U2C456_9RHOB|nr:hypothetical protein [Pararhodobacter marinus]PWE26647.1 hypothetical protein C4N9_20490 [Pararhodobacter marinus]
MSIQRKTLRRDLISAVRRAADDFPQLVGRPLISAWSQALDPTSLPVIGIAVPTELREAVAQDSDGQEFRAIVVVKIACPGDDSSKGEDTLDDAAEALIGPIEDALMTDTRDVALISSAIDISDSGSPRVGTLTLTFGASTTRARNIP